MFQKLTICMQIFDSGEYGSHYQNETAPTSPSMNGGQVSGAQNQTSGLTNNCDCSNVQNVQEMAPTEAGATPNSPAGGDNPASGSSSRK